MRALADLVERLCRVSSACSTARIEWPAHLAREQWHISPELLSLAGTPELAAMSEAARQRLSFHEAVSFFSLNLHGERFLLAGLTGRAAAPTWPALAPYLAHFRAEEERHMAYFGEFCRRYAGEPYRDRALTLPAQRAPDPGEEDVLFFGRVLIFEEIADAYNQRVAADPRVAPLAREINRLHHVEETRHLAFGRAVMPALLAGYAPQWSSATFGRIRAALDGYVKATWRAYYNPDVYRDAGFDDAYQLRERAFATPHAGAHRRAVNRRCLRVLRALHIVSEEGSNAFRD